MDSVLTPGTAFLNSLLEPNNFYTSSDPSPLYPAAEQDKFAQAFETHNNESSLSNLLLKARPSDASFSHHNHYNLDPTSQGPPPGLTESSSSSSGHADSSESPEQDSNEIQPFGQLSPKSAARIERNTAQEWWALGNYVPEAQSGQHDVEMGEQNGSFMPMVEIETQPKQTSATPRKGRKRAKLSQQELDVKHHAFLERNRVAAGKCRTRKKKRVEGLEERFMTVKGVNFGLKEAVRDLEAEIWSLKELLARGPAGDITDADFTSFEAEMEDREQKDEGETNEGNLQEEASDEMDRINDGIEAIEGDKHETKAID